MSGDKQNRARTEDHELDKTVEGTFPASDPPGHAPPPGSRKAEQAKDQPDAKRPPESKHD